MSNAALYAEIFYKLKWFDILALAGIAICGLWVVADGMWRRKDKK